MYPADAFWRKQMRQRPKRRRTLRGRPHTRQRRTVRVMNFGFLAALMRIARVAMISPRARPSLPERHAELAQESPRPVVLPGVGHDRDVQSLRLVRLGVVDLRKHEVVADAERVIPPAVEGLGGHAAEVADPRERDVD